MAAFLGLAQPSIGSGAARVQARVYDTAAVPAPVKANALHRAAAILDAAGIDIAWVVCQAQDSSANPRECETPLSRDELAARLVSLPGTPSTRGELSMGYSLIDSRASAGTLATVYVNRVEWLASQAGTDPAPLLGFALAHELGHLLLGTRAHGTTGLMRAVWSRGELQRNDPADWLFTSDECAAMARALSSRQLRIAANLASTR